MSKRYPPGPNDYLLGMGTMGRMKRDVLGVYSELHRDYGDSVSFRTGPYRLFIFYHPAQIQELLVARAKSTIRLPRVMETLAQWNGNSLLVVEGKQWAKQRRMVQGAFQPRRMAAYGSVMTDAARELASSLTERMDRSGSVDVDIDSEMTRLTLAIICRTMFGSDVTDVADQIQDAVRLLSTVAFHEMQSPIRLPMWIPTGFNRRKRAAIETLDEIVWKMIRARQKDSRERNDLLSILLNAVDVDEAGEVAGAMSQQQARDEAMTLMLAGHDTSAAAFDWLWCNLATHPEAAQRCREEIAQAVGDRAAAMDDIPQLPYLTAVVKETLRLYPPAIGVLLRQATENFSLGEFEIPKGGLITTSFYVAQRDARWFPDPETFRPERFLPGEVERIPAGAYLPFGAGPRVCIGQAFAMAELILVAAELLPRFDIALPPAAAAPEPHVTMALRPRDPLILRWSRREPGAGSSTG